MICWKCGKETLITKIQRSDECPFCAADLHCCKACIFYSAGSHFECRETVEMPVADKEKSNFCEYFQAKTDFNSSKKTASAKDIAASLFGENPADFTANDSESAKNAFNSLFGDS